MSSGLWTHIVNDYLEFCMNFLLKRPRIYYVFILLVISTSLLIHFLVKLLRYVTEESEQDLSTHDFLNLTVVQYGPERILAEQCFDSGCYIIKDALINPFLRFPLERKLIEKETRQVRATAVLALPIRKVRSEIDSSKWLMKRYQFYEGSLDSAIVEAALLSGALPFDKNAPVSVLIVGVGSGSVANFIDFHYKKSNITMLEKEKAMAFFLIDWFGIIPSTRLQIHLGDEMEQILTLAEEKNEKFQIVFYNMCPQTIAHHYCPEEKILTDQIIRSIVELVGEKGVFIVPLITSDIDATSVYWKQKIRFEQFFNECILLKPIRVYSQVLSCTQNNHNSNNEPLIKDFLKAKSGY